MPKKSTNRKKRSSAKKAGGGASRKVGFGFKGVLIVLALAMLGVVAAVCITYGLWASTFDISAVKEMPTRSTVYDMDGKVYSRLQGANRIVVPISKVSKNFIDAVIAREDSRFHSHRGVDLFGIIRAVVRNFGAGGTRQGASTLTQQLARNSFPVNIGSKKSIHRKLLEAFVASRIEQAYTKQEILEHYVNRIYFGGGVYGIEAASLVYFGKSAADLSLGEAAMIAGVIRAPTYSSPFQHPERATQARDVVLARMVKTKKITEKEAEQAKGMLLAIVRKRPVQPQESYAMDAVRRDLEIILNDEQRAEGGLKIYTSLDPALQRAAESAVDSQLRKVEARAGYDHPKRADFSDEAREEEAATPYLQGAAVVIDNASGGIRALVGGRDYRESKFNRAILSRRQIGSTFKPFVYAAAYGRGILPGAGISDERIGRGEIRGAANWTPDNSDGTYKGTMRCEEGLIQSRNTMSVRVGELAGLPEVVRLAAAAGLRDVPQQPAIYLGAFEGTLSEVTAAYTVFPNHGLRRQSYIIERIDDASGTMIYRAAHIQTPAMDAGVAWLTNGSLRKVFDKGTAASARNMGWKGPAGGKTGTTNEYRDAWFIGYSSSLTCGVWVGLDRPETIVARGYGSALALPIWASIMTAAPEAKYPAQQFKSPVALREVDVCSVSNALATSGCARSGAAYGAALPVSLIPRHGCEVHRGGVIAGGNERAEPKERRRSTGEGIFRSFRRFFGGD